ncbi:Protein lin-54-like [Gracilariopsis chorda]|uniref:Protein lin-54-like n=1 Tax=Gracilariopsis chorda TaxID=448386 RepID=A0A2V3IHA2_9FLOR|nr:Protein lin-54-like [Gracilariopsis chorda]|eukprot:PXF41486.1 Protein lin-54-like [Gracilariopsis chorda]
MTEPTTPLRPSPTRPIDPILGPSSSPDPLFAGASFATPQLSPSAARFNPDDLLVSPPPPPATPDLRRKLFAAPDPFIPHPSTPPTPTPPRRPAHRPLLTPTPHHIPIPPRNLRTKSMSSLHRAPNSDLAVRQARSTVLSRDPRAFEPRIKAAPTTSDIHTKGCNCRKGCSKNYCVCRELRVACGPRCTCSGPNGCQNRSVHSERNNLSEQLRSKLPSVATAAAASAAPPPPVEAGSGGAHGRKPVVSAKRNHLEHLTPPSPLPAAFSAAFSPGFLPLTALSPPLKLPDDPFDDLQNVMSDPNDPLISPEAMNPRTSHPILAPPVNRRITLDDDLSLLPVDNKSVDCLIGASSCTPKHAVKISSSLDLNSSPTTDGKLFRTNSTPSKLRSGLSYSLRQTDRIDKCSRPRLLPRILRVKMGSGRALKRFHI